MGLSDLMEKSLRSLLCRQKRGGENGKSVNKQQRVHKSNPERFLNKLSLVKIAYSKYLRERKMFTFAMVFVPRVDTVLNPIAHKGIVNTHVAVAEECIG